MLASACRSQAEVNQLAPGGRRGEVTAAYLTCVYSAVAAVSITAGILGDLSSLSTAVAGLAAVIAVTAAGTTAWHLSDRQPSSVG
jgi:hypothetical protein